MSVTVTRALRVGTVALCSIGILGAGASAASANAVRQGTTTALPTAASPLVPTGTLVSAPLLGSATLDAPAGSANCTAGAVQGVLATNPGNNGAGPAAQLTPDTTTGTSNSFSVRTCTDTFPNVGVRQVSLSATGGNLRATNTTLTIPTPTLRVVFDVAGTAVVCPARFANNGADAVGAVSNGTAPNAANGPSVTFANQRIYSTAPASSDCGQALGTSSTGAAGNSSVLNAKFAPTKTGDGRFVGIF